MELSPTLFWDCDYAKIDFEKNYQLVISRVLDRGTLEEWNQIKAKYGISKILYVAQNINYLSKKSVYFLSTVYDVPLTSFKCYNLMQSQPEHWIYSA
jgi:hypothetical protein